MHSNSTTRGTESMHPSLGARRDLLLRAKGNLRQRRPPAAMPPVGDFQWRLVQYMAIYRGPLMMVRSLGSAGHVR